MSLPDSTSIHLCTLLSSAAFGVMFLALWLIRDRSLYYLLCGAGALTYTATLVGLALPPGGIAWSTLLCFGLGAYNSYMLAAMRVFEGKPALNGWTIAPAIAAGAAYAFGATLLPGGVVTGQLAHSAILGVSTLAVGIVLLRTRGSHAPRSRRILAIIQLAYVPCYIASIMLDLSGDTRSNWLALVPLLSDQLLMGVLNVALLAMAGERAERALRDAALRDPLTGAWNRAGLTHLERTLALPATVILFDIDHFKQINDRDGHAAGDAVLVSLARGAIAALPAPAHLVRLGGDEFAAILPTTGDRHAASQIAERLRAIPAPSARWTISLGLAPTVTGETDLTGAISRADAMLYRAKAAGRDCLAA